MSFIWPIMLVFLIFIPLFVFLYILLQRRRRRMMEKYGSLGFVQSSSGRGPGLRRHIPPLFFLAGLTILFLSLARPETVVNLPRQEGTIILAFDVSGSMAADDMQPTRMEAAKTAARAFIERQPSTVRIGVVAFSDGGFSVQPPTNDQQAILAAIARLRPQRGTSLARGIEASLNSIAVNQGQGGQGNDSSLSGGPTAEPTPSPTPLPKGVYIPAAIVLLTDGENNQNPSPLSAAQTAADRGVRIYSVGIGSAAGSILHIEGFTVRSRLDEATLQQISQLTSGKYYNAENQQDLQSIYENLNPELVIKPEKMEVTSLFAGASMILLLFGGALSMLWFSRVP